MSNKVKILTLGLTKVLDNPYFRNTGGYLMLLLFSRSSIIVKPGSRSMVYLKSLRNLDLELNFIIAMSPTNTTHETFLSEITLKSLHI